MRHRTRSFLPTVFSVLCAFEPLQAQTTGFLHTDTLQYNGTGAINLVLTADGYTAEEQDKFTDDARRCFDYLFSISPFDRYRDCFNLYTIHVASEQSGITHPGVSNNGHERKCPEGKPFPLQTRNTFFGVYLDNGGMHRLLGYRDHRAVTRFLQEYCPGYHLAGILSNTPEYGGAGGELLLSTCNEQSNEIFVHELAHSFANLADEYYAGDHYRSEKPNMTAQSNPHKVRWSHWLDQPEVGVYAHRGTELAAQCFKPTEASDSSRYCKMQVLGKEFCPVCREAIVERIHELCNPIAEVSPHNAEITFPSKKRKNGTLLFELISLRISKGGTPRILWTLDNKAIARNNRVLKVRTSKLNNGKEHKVTAWVSDESEFVRTPQHGQKHVYTHTWVITSP